MNNNRQSRFFPPIAIIGMLFFVFGFVTWLNGVLIPYLKIACELNNFQSYLVAFAFYIAYLVMAIPASMVIQRFGFKKSMAVGLVIIAAGALIFIPAALTRAFPLFLAGLFVQGTGLAVLQTSSNPYVTVLGPAESAAKRISIMGICNKLAGAIAPIALASVILQDIDQLNVKLAHLSMAEKEVELAQLAHRVITPYLIIMVVLILLSVVIYFSTLPEVDLEGTADKKADKADPALSISKFPHLILGVIALFLYVGAEVLAGDSIISYGASQHIPISISKYFTTCTLCSMIIGYIAGIIFIPKYLKQETALSISAILGVVLTIVTLASSGLVSVFAIALLGLANSLMWPAIWPLALRGLGRLTKTGSSLLVMGIAGGALIPLLYGRVADLSSVHSAYAILLPIYLFILYYALIGHKRPVAI